MKRRPFLCLLLAVLSSLSVLTGCGSASEAAPAETEPVSVRETLLNGDLDAELPGECLVAYFELRGHGLLAYGLAEPVDGGKQYEFIELFTAEPLFRYDAAADGGTHRAWKEDSVPFSSLSAHFDAADFLIVVDNWSVDAEYLDDAAADGQSGEIETLRDAYGRYFNVVPDYLRFVTLSPDGRELFWAELPPGLTQEETIEGVWFTRLSAEEEAEATRRLHITDWDDDWKWVHCHCAALYVNGEPKVILGTCYWEGSNVFLFRNLFTCEDLFVYKSTNNPDWAGQYIASTYETHDQGPLEYEPIHPYFASNDCELVFVDLSPTAVNFITDVSGQDLMSVEDNYKYVTEFYPDPLITDTETTLEEQAHAYLNVVPESMWITAEDLEAAAEAKR